MCEGKLLTYKGILKVINQTGCCDICLQSQCSGDRLGLEAGDWGQTLVIQWDCASKKVQSINYIHCAWNTFPQTTVKRIKAKVSLHPCHQTVQEGWAERLSTLPSDCSRRVCRKAIHPCSQCSRRFAERLSTHAVSVHEPTEDLCHSHHSSSSQALPWH